MWVVAPESRIQTEEFPLFGYVVKAKFLKKEKLYIPSLGELEGCGCWEEPTGATDSEEELGVDHIEP